MTWKKEGIASHWTGARGYRKRCCKNCCVDMSCSGCGLCRGCIASPVRGNYDGLVVLAAITRESLPNYPQVMRETRGHIRRQLERTLDHGQFAQHLEFSLTSHFMYASVPPDLQNKCVPSARMASVPGEMLEKPKKFLAHAIYVAYRLEPGMGYTHQAKMSRARSYASQKTSFMELTATEEEVDQPIDDSSTPGLSK